jgi:hypothetical protein
VRYFFLFYTKAAIVKSWPFVQVKGSIVENLEGESDEERK